MQDKPQSGDVHMENARTSLQYLARFLGQEHKGIPRRANPDQNGQSGGERQPGQVFLIKPNQIKPVWLLRPVQIGEPRSVRSGGPRCLVLADRAAQDSVV